MDGLTDQRLVDWQRWEAQLILDGDRERVVTEVADVRLQSDDREPVGEGLILDDLIR